MEDEIKCGICASKNITIELTAFELSFISECLLFSKTPSALLKIGTFVDIFSEEVTRFTSIVNDLSVDFSAQIQEKRKEFYNGDVLLEGKTIEEVNASFEPINKNYIESINQEKNILVKKEIESSIFYDFFYAFSEFVSFEKLDFKKEGGQDFLHSMYIVTKKLYEIIKAN